MVMWPNFQLTNTDLVGILEEALKQGNLTRIKTN